MASSEIRMAVQISPLQCRQDRTRRGVGWLRTNVYAACSGGVVVVVLGDLVTLEAFCKRPRGGSLAFYYEVEHVNGFYGEPKFSIYF